MGNTYSWLHNEFSESAETKLIFIKQYEEQLATAIDLIVSTLTKGNKILICWNGGSAGDAQHFAAELTGRFETERNPLPWIALTTDTSALTAIGNDYGYDKVFERQVRALWKEWDILIGISTSGNSANVIEAIDVAQARWMKTIWLLWKNGGQIKDLVDHALIVEVPKTSRIQETHITIIHAICKAIDNALTPH